MPPKPTAKFRHTRSGFTVRFVDESTFSGPSLTYDWRFFEMNGASLGRSVDDDPRKNFPPSDGPREVKVRLTVKDKWGQTDSTTRTITVAPVPAPAPAPEPEPTPEPTPEPAPVPPAPEPGPPAPEPQPGPGESLPELPRLKVDIRYVAATGRRIDVAAGGNLQAALDSAQPGDEVVLAAGAIYVGSFTVQGRGILIRTSADVLPGRVARTAGFARLVSPSGASTRVLTFKPTAQDIRLVGIEATFSSTVTSGNAVAEVVPGAQRIVFDRCYFHGRPDMALSRAVIANGAFLGFVGCDFSECHTKGTDSQAILAWNGSGPFHIEDCFLEGAGENIMFGGALADAGVIPSDITILRNRFYKNPAWRYQDAMGAWQSRWTVKNIFEIKSAQRLLLEGNVLEHCWTDGQTGDALNIKISDQNGANPWNVCDDFTFRNNIVRHVDGGIKMSSTRRALFENNLIEDLAAYGKNGRCFTILGGNRNVTLVRNSGYGTYSAITGTSDASPGLTLLGNLMTRGQYGIKSSSTEGTASLAATYAPWVMEGNAIVGARASLYPSGNHFPATVAEAEAIAGVGVDRAQLEAATKGVVR